MKHNPFQIARWALVAGFGLLVLVVCLPNPSPSLSWKLAEQARYGQRSPKSSGTLPSEEAAPPQWAKQEALRRPLRTAHLPARFANGDAPQRGIRIQEPIFVPDDEPAEIPQSGSGPRAPGTSATPVSIRAYPKTSPQRKQGFLTSYNSLACASG